jgi:hypothetical protein
MALKLMGGPTYRVRLGYMSDRERVSQLHKINYYLDSYSWYAVWYFKDI